MTRTRVNVSWEPESGILEVTWAPGGGTYEAVDGHERVLERVDAHGNTLGFMVHEFTAHGGPNALEFELAGEARAGVSNLTADLAAKELGVSGARVRKLLGDGRIKGARKIGRDWLVPAPVKVEPAADRAVGVAGGHDKEEARARGR